MKRRRSSFAVQEGMRCKTASDLWVGSHDVQGFTRGSQGHLDDSLFSLCSCPFCLGNPKQLGVGHVVGRLVAFRKCAGRDEVSSGAPGIVF